MGLEDSNVVLVSAVRQMGLKSRVQDGRTGYAAQKTWL